VQSQSTAFSGDHECTTEVRNPSEYLSYCKLLFSAPLLKRHDFYETDERLILSIYDKGAAQDKVSVSITSTSVSCSSLALTTDASDTRPFS